MRKKGIGIMTLAVVLLLSGCAQNANPTQGEESSSAASEQAATVETVPGENIAETVAEIVSETVSETETTEEISEATEGSNILIVYFSRLENTDADLDTIVQGGGPYGAIGESYAEADMDAISSASITVRDGEVLGNTQAVAEMIQATTGGDLFSIQTVESYPVNYDELIDLGGEERNASARPELTEQVENMEQYDTIFIGFPNWWYDMPMALYSFLEAYDLSGKTIIPFATSAGSGLSDAVNSIQTAQPDAVVESNGIHIPMREVNGAESRIAEWIQELGIMDVAAE